MDLQQELTEQRNSRFLALLEPVYEDCQRWAMHLTRNPVEAEDVLSEALTSALTSLSQLKNDGAFKTWMFRIINNTYRMSLRRGKRPVDLVDPTDLGHVKSERPDAYLRDERARAVRQALEKLAPEQREALWLFHVHGLSSREVSDVLGKQEGAVRVMLTRARDRLAQQLRLLGMDSDILGELK
ncbi:RNA polymerase sigma factor [bacterium]|nr:RNA polymerase sigma factor [bacterium]